MFYTRVLNLEFENSDTGTMLVLYKIQTNSFATGQLILEFGPSFWYGSIFRSRLPHFTKI